MTARIRTAATQAALGIAVITLTPLVIAAGITITIITVIERKVTR